MSVNGAQLKPSKAKLSMDVHGPFHRFFVLLLYLLRPPALPHFCNAALVDHGMRDLSQLALSWPLKTKDLKNTATNKHTQTNIRTAEAIRIWQPDSMVHLHEYA